MGNAGTVGVNFEGDFRTISGGLDAFVNSGIGKMLNLEAVSKSSFARVGLAGAAVAFGVYKIGESFDNAYDTIRVGTGATGKALQGLEGDFKKVVTSVPASFGDASTAIADINTRLGLTGPLLRDRAAQFLELSRITKTDVAGNVEAASKVFGAFEVQTNGQTKALDAMFRASQASGIGVAELAEQARRSSAPLRTLGLGFNESIALLAQFEKSGVNAENVIAGLKLGVKNLAQEGESVPQTFSRILAEIKAMDDPTERLNKSFELFGTRAGTDLADAIAVGAFSVEEMQKVVLEGSDTIRKAGKDTADFSEKFQLMKNKAMVAFEPVARSVFDIVGKIGDALVSLPDGSVKILALGTAAAFAIPKLAGMATSVVDVVRNGEGFTGFAQRAGLAMGGLTLGLGLVKPALDDLGVSASISGAAVGAMTGIAFGPWGAAVGGALGFIGGAFGLMGDKSEEAERRARESMARLKAEIATSAGQIVSDQGIITDQIIKTQLSQVGAFKDVGEALNNNGVSWQQYMSLVNSLRVADYGHGLTTNFREIATAMGLTPEAARALEEAMGPVALKLAQAQEEARALAFATGDLNAMNGIAKTSWDQVLTSVQAWTERAGHVVTADEMMRAAAAQATVGVREHADAVVRATGVADAGKLVMAEYRNRLADLGVQAGMSRADAERLADELTGLSTTRAAPQVDMDDSGFKTKKKGVKDDLEKIGQSAASPGVGAATGWSRIHFFPTGGRVPGQGTAHRLIAAQPGEEVVDRSTSALLRTRLRSPHALGGGGPQLVIQGDVYGMPDFERKVKELLRVARRSGEDT